MLWKTEYTTFNECSENNQNVNLMLAEGWIPVRELVKRGLESTVCNKVHWPVVIYVLKRRRWFWQRNN